MIPLHAFCMESKSTQMWSGLESIPVGGLVLVVAAAGSFRARGLDIANLKEVYFNCLV